MHPFFVPNFALEFTLQRWFIIKNNNNDEKKKTKKSGVGIEQIPHQSEKVLRLVRIKRHLGEWHSFLYTDASDGNFTLQMQEMADE